MAEDAMKQVYINCAEDINIPDDDLPHDLQEPQFDIVLIYARKDQQHALTFKDVLEKFIILSDNQHAKVCVLDRGDNLVAVGSKFKHLGLAVRRSTYMFLFMTPNFVQDSWAELQGDECLQESIDTPERRWCVIPIYALPMQECGFQIPFGLKALKGVHCNHILRDRQKNFHANLNVSALKTEEIDPYFKEQMQRLLNARIGERQRREKQQEIDIKECKKQARERKFKEYLQERANEERKRQDIKKRADEMRKVHNNDIADLEGENSSQEHTAIYLGDAKKYNSRQNQVQEQGSHMPRKGSSENNLEGPRSPRSSRYEGSAIPVNLDTRRGDIRMPLVRQPAEPKSNHLPRGTELNGSRECSITTDGNIPVICDPQVQPSSLKNESPPPLQMGTHPINRNWDQFDTSNNKSLEDIRQSSIEAKVGGRNYSDEVSQAEAQIIALSIQAQRVTNYASENQGRNAQDGSQISPSAKNEAQDLSIDGNANDSNGSNSSGCQNGPLLTAANGANKSGKRVQKSIQITQENTVTTNVVPQQLSGSDKAKPVQQSTGNISFGISHFDRSHNQQARSQGHTHQINKTENSTHSNTSTQPHPAVASPRQFPPHNGQMNHTPYYPYPIPQFAPGEMPFYHNHFGTVPGHLPGMHPPQHQMGHPFIFSPYANMAPGYMVPNFHQFNMQRFDQRSMQDPELIALWKEYEKEAQKQNPSIRKFFPKLKNTEGANINLDSNSRSQTNQNNKQIQIKQTSKGKNQSKKPDVSKSVSLETKFYPLRESVIRESSQTESNQKWQEDQLKILKSASDMSNPPTPHISIERRLSGDPSNSHHLVSKSTRNSTMHQFDSFQSIRETSFEPQIHLSVNHMSQIKKSAPSERNFRHQHSSDTSDMMDSSSYSSTSSGDSAQGPSPFPRMVSDASSCEASKK